MQKKVQQNVIPCFRRWSRNSWATFASMKKEVKIGVLSVGMTILSLPFQQAYAQSQTIVKDSIEQERQRQLIEEVRIIAQRTNPTRGIINPIEIYNRSKMKAAPLQTIESALKINPAVDLRERGSKGVQADISLFGGTTDQTMVMLNGINFTDARTGHQSHSLPIDMNIVQGINIIPGVTGIGAYSGAINIITTPEKSNYLNTEISGGQYGYFYGNITAGASFDNVSTLFMGSLRKSSGYTENTDFRRENFYNRTTINSKAGIFDFQIGTQTNFFGANSFYSFTYPDQAEETQTYLASLKWTKNFNNFIKASLYTSYRRNTDRFELFRHETADWYKGHNYHLTNDIGSGGYIEKSWLGGRTSLGVDYAYNQIFSNVLGLEMETPKPVYKENNINYTKSDQRHIFNSWLRHSIVLGDYELLGSLNYGGYNSQNQWTPTLMWNIGTNINLSKSIRLQAFATQSMRLPTYTDLYYTTSTHTGNTDLTPERAITYRVSGIYYNPESKNLPGLKSQISIYYRQGNDIIDWVKKVNEQKWQSMQITSLNTFGAELQISYSFNKILKEISLGYGYNKTDKDSQDYISRYALDYLKNKINILASIEPFESFTINLMGTWYDRSGQYQDTDGKLVDYTSPWILDARVKYDIQNLGIFIDLSNILNSDHYDFGGLLLPGLWITAGINISI